MSAIMISYRRKDSPSTAGRIFDRLESCFGKGSVFMDIESLQTGEDFRSGLTAVLNQRGALIAIIGPRWLHGENGLENKLSNPNDWVRIEIETALARKIPIIPVLVDGASMPAPGELPEAIRDLAFHQAAVINSDVDFGVHTGRLIKTLKTQLGTDNGQVIATAVRLIIGAVAVATAIFSF